MITVRARGPVGCGAVIGLLVACALTVASAPAGALTPPPQPDERCVDFVHLRDVADTTAAATTARAVFVSIRNTARAFDRLAAESPAPIADDMELLASSYAELWKAIRPIEKKIRAADDADSANRALAKIAGVVERWSADQDVDALADAQAGVDDWLGSSCGFRFGPEPDAAE